MHRADINLDPSNTAQISMSMNDEQKCKSGGRKTLPKNIMSGVNTVGVKTKKSVMDFFSRGQISEESVYDGMEDLLHLC